MSIPPYLIYELSWSESDLYSVMMEERNNSIAFFTLESSGLSLKFTTMLMGFVGFFLLAVIITFDKYDFGFLILQTGLLTSLLMFSAYQKKHVNSGTVAFKTGHWVLLSIYFLMLFLDLILSPGYMAHIDLQRLSYIFSFVMISGTMVWSIPRTISHLPLMSRRDANLISVLIAVMMSLLIISIVKISSYLTPGMNTSVTLELAIFLVMVILFYATIHHLIVCLKDQTAARTGRNEMENDQMTIYSPLNWTPIADLRQMLEMVTKIEHELESQKLYLDPSVSLDVLSERTEIPKHKISHIFNTYFNKGFYQMIGEYRIRYAMKILYNDQNTSMDGLSDICGFSSKTTFYKYFKQVNGCTPNEFVRNLNSGNFNSHSNVEF